MPLFSTQNGPERLTPESCGVCGPQTPQRTVCPKGGYPDDRTRSHEEATAESGSKVYPIISFVLFVLLFCSYRIRSSVVIVSCLSIILSPVLYRSVYRFRRSNKNLSSPTLFWLYTRKFHTRHIGHSEQSALMSSKSGLCTLGAEITVNERP